MSLLNSLCRVGSLLNTDMNKLISCICRDPDLVKRIGSATALEVRATGINYVFAPCIAVRYTIKSNYLNISR